LNEVDGRSQSIFKPWRVDRDFVEQSEVWTGNNRENVHGLSIEAGTDSLVKIWREDDFVRPWDASLELKAMVIKQGLKVCLRLHVASRAHDVKFLLHVGAEVLIIVDYEVLCLVTINAVN